MKSLNHTMSVIELIDIIKENRLFNFASKMRLGQKPYLFCFIRKPYPDARGNHNVGGSECTRFEHLQNVLAVFCAFVPF